MDKYGDLKEEEEMKLVVNDGNINNNSITVQPENKKSSLEYLQSIFDKSGITFSQSAIVFAGCLLYYNYGSLQYELNFIYPELTRVFDMNSFDREILTISYFLGAMIGCILSVVISKYFMRKTPAIIFTFTMCVFSLLPIVFTNLAWFSFCRFCTGISLGCALCLFFSTTVEILPTSRREFGMTIVLSFNRVGIICYVLIYRVLLFDLRMFGNKQEVDAMSLWKYSLQITTFGTIFLFIVTWVAMKESPRFLIINNEVTEGVRVLKELVTVEGGNNTIETPKLNKEALDYHANNENYNFFDLFSKKYIKLCALTGVCLLVAAMNNNANNYALPLIIKDQNGGNVWIVIIIQQLLALGGNIGGAFLAHTSTFGRRYTILSGFGLVFITSVITLIINSGFEVTSPIMNVFISVSVTVAKIYVMEVYPTSLRLPALALCLAIAQLGDLLAPVFCDLLYGVYPYGPIILPLVNSIIGLLCSYFFPFETAQKSLDSIGDE